MSNMEIREALGELGNAERWPHVPSALVCNLARCVRADRPNRATRALQEDARSVIPAIDRMFGEASLHTGLSPDELLRRTGFHVRDTDAVRVDTAFAELRTIGYLVDQGFEGIELLGPKDHQRADIRARLRDVGYVLEVATSICDAEHRDAGDDVVRWIVGRAKEGKLTQLNLTAEEFGGAVRAFVAVIDSKRLVALGSPNEFRGIALDAWCSLGEAPDLHVCVITGRITLGEGPDNSVWPPWRMSLHHVVV